MYTKKQRITAFLMLTFFVVTTLFSALFIVKEANHECSGNECSICASINNAEHIIRQFENIKINFFSFSFVAAFYVLLLFCTSVVGAGYSLTNQKVRLNN